MIDVVKQTPIEYSIQSRDYQKLARIYTVLYNLSKMYIDDMKVWETNIDNKLTTLRSKTLNFDPKHAWNLDDLDAAISCFKYVMRRKGTIQALSFCLTILLRMRKMSGIISEERGTIEVEGNKVIVKIPQQLASAGVVEDLIEYLLPAGMTYRIIEYREVGLDNVTSNLIIKNKAFTKEISINDVSIYGSHGTIESSEYNPIEVDGGTWYSNMVHE